jgi:hypothetical protein
MTIRIPRTVKTLSFLATVLLAAAQAAHAQTQSYIVTLTNLTNPGGNSGQPFSPSVFATHDSSLSFWDAGAPASFGLQQIAEEGNNAPFLADLALAGPAVGSTNTFGAPTLPGQSVTFFITTDASHPFLSSAWMLGRTNDGFSGIRSFDLRTIGASPLTIDLLALDAGTEVNNEQNAYLPARGGVFNDPENGVVDIHPGLRGSSDPTSDVPDSWKWSGPVARLSIQAAPEPGTLALVLLAPLALAFRRRRSS